MIGTVGVVPDEDDDSLQIAVKAYEREYIYQVLIKYDWNKAEAAKALGVGLSSLYRKIDELGIDGLKRERSS